MVQRKITSASKIDPYSAGLNITRRSFIRRGLILAAAAATCPWLAACRADQNPQPSPSTAPILPPNWKEVRYAERLANGNVQCSQCPRRCVIRPYERGFCQTRENRRGILYSVVYNRPCIARPVPVEKAPIFHMLPGTQSFSMATAGCNLACLYCQNYTIARAKPEEVESFDMTASGAIEEGLKARCKSITFTYAEASVAFEYLVDVAQAARQNKLKTILKTGGYINPAPLKELCAALDAINVDLKGFSESFYQQVCQGELKPVLDTILTIQAENKAWLEIANLVVPGYNDSPKQLNDLVNWVKTNLGVDTPLHFNRFEPAYRLRMPPTPVETMEKARQVALEAGLHYVYVGNLPGNTGQNTLCPSCGKLLIERYGFEVRQNQVVKGTCKFCSTPLAGRWL